MPIVRAKPTANSTATWIAAAVAAGATHAWPLNDTNTTALDKGSSPSNGTFVGAPRQAVAVSNQTGVLLNGSTQYVTLPAIELPTSSPWTIEAYGLMSTAAASANAYLFSTNVLRLANIFTNSSVFSSFQVAFPQIVTTPSLSFTTQTARCIAVDSSYIYVASPLNNLLSRYTLTGGSTAFTLGISNPYGVTVDPSGYIYVSSGSTTVATKYSSAGISSTTYTVSAGSGIWSIALDASNNVYCGGDAAVYKFANAGGAATRTIPTAGLVYGIEVDTSGYIYVATGSTGIQKFAAAGGAAILTIAGTFYNVVVDVSGNIYASSLSTVNKFSSTGTLIQTISGLTNPFGLAIDSNLLYVSDASSNILSEYLTWQPIGAQQLIVAPAHYVASYDGTNVTLSINSVAIANGIPLASLVTTSGVNAAIGTNANVLGSSSWPGSLANIAIYPTKLTAAQISSIYKSII